MTREFWSERPYDYGHRDRISGFVGERDYKSQLYIWGNPSGGNTLEGNHGSYTRTIDQRLPYWRLLQKGVIKNDGIGLWFDPGSYFWQERVSVTAPNYEVHKVGGWPPVLRETQDGPVWPCQEAHGAQVGLRNYNATIADVIAVPIQELWSHSATGIAHSLPNIPNFNLFAFMGELREGLPKIPGATFLRKDVANLFAREKRARRGQTELRWGNPGGEFLNWVFGWSPTISDVENLYSVAMNYDLVRDRMVKWLGKVTRRSRKVVRINDADFREEIRYPYPPVAGANLGHVRVDTTFRREVWVNSGFSYAPILNMLDQKMPELAQQVAEWGLIPNPASLWELIPWSWLVDWFSNVGDVLTNLSYLSHSGLRLLYSYVMAETEMVTTYTWEGTIDGAPRTIQSQVSALVKQRIASNPYWVGYTPTDWNWQKMAILSAIGIGFWPKRA